MGKKFGKLKVGEKIFNICGLKINEIKITDIRKSPISSYLIIINHFWEVGIYSENSYSNSIFSSYEKAEKWLIKKAKDRYKELEIIIDQEIQEYDRLEKFLYDKKI